MSPWSASALPTSRTRLLRSELRAIHASPYWARLSCFPRSSPRVFRQDTEFPGVVARPIGSFKSSSDFHYQTLRCNVDLLKIIQIGLTLCNEEGQLAPGICTFQFNFKFSLKCATAPPSCLPPHRPCLAGSAARTRSARSDPPCAPPQRRHVLPGLDQSA